MGKFQRIKLSFRDGATFRAIINAGTHRYL